MSLKLVEKFTNKEISVFDLPEGKIAIITSWIENSSKYNGIIVQRYGKDLIMLGKNDNWKYIFDRDTCRSELSKCRVRILEKGETLVID
jgi:hypothetical protein